VGENPLNGNGTHPRQDEDIACSHTRVCGVNNSTGSNDPYKIISLK